VARINSVLGPLDTRRLGFTLSHEHVVLSSAGIRHVYPDFIGQRNTIVANAVRILRQAKAEGVDTMVDVTTLDLGRDVRLVREVSRRSGMNIIACTGIWRDIPRAFWQARPDDVAALFVREIKEGIENTGIKAGIIKIATDMGGVTPEGEVILRAAARAAKKTGVPVSCHTWALERVGEQQVAIFQEEGLNLNQAYIGHSNDTTDLDYLTGLLKKGVWLGLDRTPGGTAVGSPQWSERAITTKHLIDAGWSHRILLGHDWCTYPGIIGPQQQKEFLARNPDNFLFITHKFLPRLREMGVPDKTITQITVDNPRRFFENKP
jgi:phosphotriesterase-related protein